jgi:hypothetical protein
MLHLWLSTRFEWEHNENAYRYGLTSGKRERFIESEGLPLSEFLNYVNKIKVFTQFDLRLKNIENEHDIQKIINFLCSVTEVDAVKFDKIEVPWKVYSQFPDLINDLYNTLQENNIDGEWIKTQNSFLDIDWESNDTEWISKCIVNINWRNFKRVGWALMKLYNSHDGLNLYQHYENFNLPVKMLWMNPFTYQGVFEKLTFHETVLNSVEKLIIDWEYK